MFTRKYHLRLPLPNSFVWEGFINVEANNKEDFPKIPEGTFYIAKDDEGWHGEFTLTNPGNCKVKYNHVISTWYSYVDNKQCPQFHSTAEAAAWMRKYDSKLGDDTVRLPVTEGKLEECLQYNKFTNEPVVELWDDHGPVALS